MQAIRSPSFFALLNPWHMGSNLWRHRGLLWQFTLRNIEIRHKGSALGVVWTVLNPLLLLAVYVFVFGFVFKGKFHAVEDETSWDYGLGIFLGLTFFHMFAECMAVAPTIVVGYPSFVKKVVFPLEVLPAASVGAAIYHMAISLAMVLVGMLLGHRGLSWSALYLPLLLPPTILLALAIAWTLSAIGVFFRDINQIIGALTTGWMFASAIFYPVQSIPPGAWAVLKFNPLIHIVEFARDCVLWQRPPDHDALMILYGSSIAAAIFGYACFRRLKSAFADVI